MDADQARAAMVQHQLARRGITDPAVLDAFRAVPREAFLPPSLRHAAYDDNALPIAEGQTISQPFVVASMLQLLALRPGAHALEVGGGSGYAAAVLARCVTEVVCVERLPGLAATARRTLQSLGVTNVEVVVADGSLGWPPAAPFDAICVSAAAPAVPPALVAQLAPGGRLVIPVGGRAAQELVVVHKAPDGTVSSRAAGDVRFVPLLGAQGFPPPEEP